MRFQVGDSVFINTDKYNLYGFYKGQTYTVCAVKEELILLTNQENLNYWFTDDNLLLSVVKKEKEENTIDYEAIWEAIKEFSSK